MMNYPAYHHHHQEEQPWAHSPIMVKCMRRLKQLLIPRNALNYNVHVKLYSQANRKQPRGLFLCRSKETSKQASREIIPGT